ncbi:phosphatidate cytidylyltransferase [Arthrobacter livingstonensis]|uniref:Phosphatidate cytidylyltransferase n=1 Tax=Arthrobacter livingstonensis TaxID=670078 RepID=A0A2V5LHH3_9MICC|nr:phosphatidate cytidylyltransferase [Arthrobacter livingstonensis]
MIAVVVPEKSGAKKAAAKKPAVKRAAQNAVPENAVPFKAARRAAALKHDAASRPGAPVADAGARKQPAPGSAAAVPAAGRRRADGRTAAKAANRAGAAKPAKKNRSAQDSVVRQPESDARNRPTQESAVRQPEPAAGNPTPQEPAARPPEPAAGNPAPQDSGIGQPERAIGNRSQRDSRVVRPPVPAASVTGLPAVPVAPAPIAPIPASAAARKAPRTPKAGRDLPAAIGVGVALLVLVLGSLLFFPLGFVVVATAFVAVGVWEVTRAIGTRGIKAPLTPVMIGTLAMPASAYFAGSEGLLFALVASAGATLLWRSLDPEPGAVKSILAGIFSLMWIPFLLSFVFLMMVGERPPTTGLTLDLANLNPGILEVVIMLLLVVANDTFGYLVGVLFGRHPMAPKISPKKSWEGFAGSMGGAMLVAIPATVFFLDVHWWVGLALAIGMVFAGTGGDFAESMVKRELGVKDMSNLLPGHGGVMDRLDSILFAAPVAYAIFSVLGRL